MADDDNSNTSPPASDGETPEQIFARLMAETEPLIPKGFAERIERDVTGNGDLAVVRRLALAFLEKPFRAMVKQAETDRAFAESMAYMSKAVREREQSYRLLADWLGAASSRMLMAVCARDDSSAIWEAVKEEKPESGFGRLMTLARCGRQ